MWEWLGTQAQSASPFVAVFCLFMLGIAGMVIRSLWTRHLEDNDAIVLMAKANTEANNAVALAIERSSSMTALAIEKLTARIDSGAVRRR